MRPFNVVLMIVVVIGLLALLVWTQEKRKATKIWVWVGTALILILVRAFLPDDTGPARWAGVADWIIPDGYVSHTVEAEISVDDNWMVGEKKDCHSEPLHPLYAFARHKEFGYVADFFDCGNGAKHSMSVKLYGRINQPEHKIAYWRCTRNPESFTCRQTGAD